MMLRHTIQALYTFDSVVDMDFSIIKYMIKKYGKSDYMNPNLVGKDGDYTIKCLLLTRTDPNPLSVFLKPKYKDMAEDLYSELIETSYEDILKHAYPTDLFGMIKTYDVLQVDAVESLILCKNGLEQQYIKLVDPSLNTDLYHPQYDLTGIDVIYVKSYEDVLGFSNLGGKTIQVLNYEYNLDELHGVKIPKTAISILVADLNKVYTVDPYINFELPKPIKERKDAK